MAHEATTARLDDRSTLRDEEIIGRVLEGDHALFEVLMRRYNQRVYRAARAIVRDDGEAEDVMQSAYVHAYEHLAQFAGRATFSTWLTRIAVHEAFARVRRRGRFVDLEEGIPALPSPARGPEQRVADGELAKVLEAAVDELPDVYRCAFMLREIEGLSTAETAECLDIPAETVKTRLHRARGLLRRSLEVRLRDGATAVFEFGFSRCDRVVAAVLARIGRIDRRRTPRRPGPAFTPRALRRSGP